MSEADYMDACQHVNLADDLSKPETTHEVVDGRNRIVWIGSRASCWDYKRHRGGFVREHLGHE